MISNCLASSGNEWCLIKHLGLHVIQISKIRIENDFVTTDHVNRVQYAFRRQCHMLSESLTGFLENSISFSTHSEPFVL